MTFQPSLRPRRLLPSPAVPRRRRFGSAVGILTLTLLLSLLAVVPAGRAQQPNVALQVRTLDFDTGLPRKTFPPGSRFVLEITATLPEPAENRRVDLTLSATVNVAGISLPFTFSGASTVLNLDPVNGGPIVGSGIERRVLSVPKEAPNLKLTVAVQAQVDGGPAASVRTTVRVAK